MNNKILKTIAILCLPIMAQAQAPTLYINNGGSTFFVSPGATVQVNGGVKNETFGNYQNQGVVNVTGDFENNKPMPNQTSGTTRFEGTTAQTVSGNAGLKTYDVVFNNPNGVTLNTSLRVKHAAYFNDGIVATPNSNIVLYFESGAIVGNTPSDTSHVNGWILNDGLGSFTYPVGDGIRYQPITINLTANPDGMYVKYNASNAGAAPFTAGGTEATPLVAYNANEFWECGPDGGSNPTGTVTMYWDNYKNTGIGNVADLKVAHLKAGNWVNEGTTATGTIASGSVTSNVVNTWSPFTLGSISINSPLPITLLSFTGKKEATSNVLNWTTSMEQNNAYFNVQRSQDAKTFTTIGKVETKATNGNSSTELNYNFTDFKPSFGGQGGFYRLQQVDNDGKSTLSKVIKLSNHQIGTLVNVYPNPTQGMLNVECLMINNGTTSIKLSDLSGRVVKEIQTSSNMAQLDMNDVSAGMYMLQVRQNNQVISTQKVEKK